MKHKVIALTAALSMLGGSIAALPAMAAEQTLLNENFNSGTVGSAFDGWFIWGDGSKLLVEGDEDNKYLTATRNAAWLGAGHKITVQTGKTYNVSLKIKSETEQIFSVSLDAITVGDQKVHPAVVMETADRTVDDDDGWKTITGTLTIPQALVNPESNTEYSVNMWLQTNYSTYSNGNYSIDDVTITYDDSTPTSGAVAKVGDTEYTSLDSAIDAANGETITLLDNATLSENRTNATAVIEGNSHTITVNLPSGENRTSIFSNLTLSNATLTGSTNQNIAINANMTNVTVDDLSYDCLVLDNFTATDCNLEHNGDVYVFAGNNAYGKLSMTDTTITINGLGYTNLVFRVPTNDTPTLSNVTIKGLTTTGTTIAEVNGNTSIEGIKVDGLANTQELKIDGNKLVIAEKTAPALFAAEVGTAEVQHGTGEFENTVATGFQATVTNNGGTKGTFKTVKWNVTLGDETKTTGDQPITNVTLDPNAKATIFLVVDNLNGEDATATVEIK